MTNELVLTPKERTILLDLDTSKLIEESSNNITPTIGLKELYSFLTTGQREVLEKLRSINPKVYGINMRYLGYEEVPKSIVTIKNQQYTYSGETSHIPPQFLPKEAWEAFVAMKRSFEVDHPGRTMLVGSG